ncbi:aminoglycoside phosphotransferase family protein [Gilvimarinus agarilyticus]|uniref:phosphotransferase n=1 Tax=Gilvimarinus sp. 2_MG-2023 TaxID=3062666 RepID=UPI001C09D079|nr:phosphotransferase [Gilvimarinus sp. 2_MG-2023]MBU2887841.1 aminoglycoside phosphotransferase family protein [Gilvimarinus agarilyticus]MDO6572479.1 phosphotransferase [Gilvimarinus sp. 2_MG-2023]
MQQTTNTPHWLWQLAQRLMQLTPFRSSQAIALTLIAQTALMLGMLLPVKIVMLLGMETIPSYMPQLVQQWSREALILSLSGLAVICFLIYLVGEKWATNLINSSVRNIVEQAGKIVLFENQEQVATNTYTKVINSLAGIIFMLVSLVVLSFIYPLTSISTIAVIAASAPAIPVLVRRARQHNQPKLLIQSLQNINNLGFLLIFAIIVVDHLYFSGPSLLFTIATIILTRQATSKLIISVADLANTAELREKNSALFFHDHVLNSHTPINSEGIWALLEIPNRKHWLCDLLEQASGERPATDTLSIHWLQSGIPNIFAFWVEADKENYIVKIYDKPRALQCNHEATLLTSESAAQLPAPELLFTGVHKEFRVNVLRIATGYTPLTNRSEFEAIATELQQTLAGCLPPTSITAPYLRSHPLLWKKLDEALVRPLLLACQKDEREQVASLLHNISALRNTLANLPTAFQNNTINPHNILIKEGQSPITWQWGQWGLDVFGCNFPANKKGFSQIQTAITLRYKNDQALNTVPASDIELASFTNALYYCLKSQRFKDALELVPEINQRLAEMPAALTNEPPSSSQSPT